MKSRWMEYKGTGILYIDPSNFRDDEQGLDRELKLTIATIGQEMYQKPEHSVPVLVDSRQTVMTQHVQAQLTERITDTRKYVRKIAVIGMTGMRKIILDFFSRIAHSETASFDTPEASFEWLVS